MNKLSIRLILRRLFQQLMAVTVKEIQPQDLKRSAIIFAPHQDDETLGCGGMIIRKRQAGADIKIVFMTDGSRSHTLISAAELVEMRTQEALNAAETLGVSAEDVFFVGIQDGELTACQAEAMAKVTELLERYKPEEVYIPYHDEPAFVADHAATYQAVTTVLENQKRSAVVYEYPIWFWRQYPWTYAKRRGFQDILTMIPQGIATGINFCRTFNYGVNIKEAIELKRLALAQHKSQTERLDGDPRWVILSDFSNRQWLECFFQTHEFFARYRFQDGVKIPFS
jgi:LmbE family N-acetylglucosaminyl deacetylase